MRILFAVLALSALTLSGCASVNPATYPTFEDWLVGDPDIEYDTGPSEYMPPARPVYGAVWGVPFMARDGLRWAVSPFVWGFNATRGLDAIPGAFFLGPNWDRPDEVSDSDLPSPSTMNEQYP